MRRPTPKLKIPRQAPWQAMLAAKPVANAAARTAVPTGATGLSVSVKSQRPSYLQHPPLSWIVPYRAERNFELDALGARIWALCDGAHTVEGIVEQCATTLDLSFHEARVLVCGYLEGLTRRGIVAMAIPAAQVEDSQA